jgi:elongator complex protein 3
VQKTAEAFELLRQFGFKIQVHWMPNLLGATLKTDYEDYIKLCTHKNFIPDEIKIYPCSLIENTKLMSHYKDKSWVPYTYDELKKLIEKYLLVTPRYCRISRVIRDISSEDIFAGNRKSNLRQDVEKNITAKKLNIVEIRFREMKNEIIEYKNLSYKETEYRTGVSKEVFMEMVDDKDRLAGFLRLSLPTCKEKIDELKGSAIIREIHVYGQSLPIGTILKGKAQHSGIGRFLINNAKKISKTKSYNKLSVISSVGTKEYYRNLGFIDGKLYQHFY